MQISLNRDRIAALGLTVNQVETALFNAYGTRQVSQIYAASNQYQVILQVAPEFQQDPAALSMLYVRSTSGKLIPLNTVATVTTGVGPLSVSHTGQLPSVNLTFNLKPGYALGDAVNAIEEAARTTLPSTVTTKFQGAAQAFQESLQGLGLVLVMAIVVIYIVLGILYESFTQPLVILSGLPAAGFGALLTLILFKTELSLYAFVGIIMLVGLVKKNGIMMVDFASAAEREQGKTPLEAIHEACLVRFRPIMMTTMCALVGTLPIALGLGAGAESRRPLGLAVVGGLLVSQFLTLYITPVYYVYIEGARLRLVKRKAKTPDEMEAGRRVRTRVGGTLQDSALDPAAHFHSDDLESREPRAARGVDRCGTSKRDRRCRSCFSPRASSSPASASPQAWRSGCGGPAPSGWQALADAVRHRGGRETVEPRRPGQRTAGHAAAARDLRHPAQRRVVPVSPIIPSRPRALMA